MFFVISLVFVFDSQNGLMKNCTLFLLLSFLFVAAQAQTKKQFSVDLNRSNHGSGDLPGLGFAVEYGSYFAYKLEWTAGIAANVHHGEEKLLLNQGGELVDASFRMVTAGLQLQGQLNYAFLQTGSHEAKLGIGPVLRYQSSSVPNSYGIVNPVVTSYPDPVFTFRHEEDQNIITAGYLASVSYAYTFHSNLFIGAKASFQNDTNADVITQYGLHVGKRF